MRKETAHFFSDGLKLEGYFYSADQGAKEKMPLVIVCSGFTGLACIHPERFARAFTPQGYLCFGFDYRGFGNSEGATGQVLLDEQIRDIANAIEYISERAAAESRKIILAGWGMAGGLVLKVPLLTNKVSGLVSMNGFYNNDRVQLALRGSQQYKTFKQWLRKQRALAVQGKNNNELDPFDIYPLDPITKEYVDNVLRKTEGYGLSCSLSFADSLLSFNAESGLEALKDLPYLIAHGAKNVLHPIAEAKSIHNIYPGHKELFLLEGGGHTEWMLDEHPLFIQFSNHIAQWIHRVLK